MKKMLTLAAAIVCAVLALGAAGGCKNEENFSEKSYSCAGESVQSVNIDVRDSAVEIAPSEDGTLRLAYYESEARTYEIALTDGTLAVTLAKRDGLGGYFGVLPDAQYRRIRLFLPESALKALAVSTTNEDITLAPLSCTDSVTLESNGGNIGFEGLFAREIGLTAKNGDITGSIAGGWDDFSILCTVKKGESNLPEQKEGGANALRVDCNNGDVAISFER